MFFISPLFINRDTASIFLKNFETKKNRKKRGKSNMNIIGKVLSTWEREVSKFVSTTVYTALETLYTRQTRLIFFGSADIREKHFQRHRPELSLSLSRKSLSLSLRHTRIQEKKTHGLRQTSLLAGKFRSV